MRLSTYWIHNSNPVPRVADDCRPLRLFGFIAGFQSTSSVWRTTKIYTALETFVYISIHVLRVEDDWVYVLLALAGGDFNPRPPCGGRRSNMRLSTYWIHISIHVLRVEDDLNLRHFSLTGTISIHVLRVEDDL